VSRELVDPRAGSRHRAPAAFSPVTPFIESAASEVYGSPLRKAIQQVCLPVVDGAIALPTAPGIGVELPPELIDEFLLSPDKGWRYHEDP
jgi:L-alanine-DL-glutamate epimerase-like enolase superfamily enzyme